MRSLVVAVFFVAVVAVSVQAMAVPEEDRQAAQRDVCKDLRPNDDLQPAWSTFKRVYQRQFGSAQDESERWQIFEKNARQVIAHNEQYRQGLATFKEACNKFTDRREDEIPKGFNP